MPIPARPTGTFWQRLTLVVSAPVVFLLLSDITIRVSGIETDVARNENFEIRVPVWLLGDENWVDIQRVRLEEPRGVSHFEEARYIQYKLKPNIEIDASNPFNRMELRKGKTFRLVSNSHGFRTREFESKPPGVTRIVTIGDSSTFGWGRRAGVHVSASSRGAVSQARLCDSDRGLEPRDLRAHIAAWPRSLRALRARPRAGRADRELRRQ